jgi:hypothetical protein
LVGVLIGVGHSEQRGERYKGYLKLARGRAREGRGGVRGALMGLGVQSQE